MAIALVAIGLQAPTAAVAAISVQRDEDPGATLSHDIVAPTPTVLSNDAGIPLSAMGATQHGAGSGFALIAAAAAAEQAQMAPTSTAQTQTPDDAEPDPEKLLEKLEGRKISPSERLDGIDVALGRGQVFSDLRSLQDTIVESQKPAINFTAQHSSQSDGLDIYHAELSNDISLSRGRSQLRVGVQYLNFDPSSGSSISQIAGGFVGKHRISDVVSVNAEAWLNRIGLTNRDDYKLTYNAYLTLQPNDVIRVYISTGQKTFDNITSLTMGITARSVGASIDYSPVDSMRWTLRGSGEFYSDDNSKQSIEAEAIWRIVSRPTLEVGGRGTYFRFSKLLNNGYFNPNDYLSGEVMFRLRSPLSKRLDAELTASGGIEHANPGGSKPVVKSSLQMSYAITKHWSLDGGASYFSSRDSSSSGFSRTTFTLSIHYRL